MSDESTYHDSSQSRGPEQLEVVGVVDATVSAADVSVEEEIAELASEADRLEGLHDDLRAQLAGRDQSSPQ